MNQLLSIRANVLYTKEIGDKLEKVFEVIFLTDKAEYRRSTEGEIIRERGINELRFTVLEKNFDNLIKSFASLKDMTENDLTLTTPNQ